MQHGAPSTVRKPIAINSASIRKGREERYIDTRFKATNASGKTLFCNTGCLSRLQQSQPSIKAAAL